MQMKEMIRATAGLVFATAFAGGAHAAVHIGPGCAYARIQDAIDALAPSETEYRVSAGTYRENLLFNSPFESHRLQIRGGYIGCTNEVVDDPDTTIIDASGTNRSAVAITGLVDATFANLTITGGNAPQGGGIVISGGGQLALDAVHLSTNAAQSGGGLFAFGSSGLLTVSIGKGTLISGNTASLRGGGVVIGGTARLLMNAQQSAIAYNSSLSDEDDAGGGGLAIAGPARADIGSGGYFNAAASMWYGAISHNNAARGGGIDVRNGGTLRLCSTDLQRGLYLHDNQAVSEGGSVFAKDATSMVCAWNVAIRASKANEGAAIFARDARTSFRHDTVFEQCGPESAADLGAVECPEDNACNRIEDNSASLSIVAVKGDAALEAERIQMLGNQSSNGRLVGSEGVVGLQNCLLARNYTHFIFEWNRALSITACTITDNATTGVDEVFRTMKESSLTLSQSIIIGDDYVLEPRLPPASATISDVITSHAGQLDLGEHQSVVVGDPGFVDVAAGDYHLGAGSIAIDFSASGPALDLDGRTRGVAASPAGSNRPFDLGAFEAGPGVLGDVIFKDAFERAL